MVNRQIIYLTCASLALLVLNAALYASDLFDVGSSQLLAGGGIGEGAAAGRVSVLPQGIAIGPDGRVYIADEQYNRVRVVGTDGIVATVIGSGRYGFDGDGLQATASAMQIPASVAFAADGRLFMVDLGNRRVRVVESDGTLRTVFGESDLPAMPNRFAPYDLDVDTAGRIYVADRGNHVVWRWSAGVVERIAGTGQRGFAGDKGLAVNALLADPRSVAVGLDGAIFIADTGNGRVRRVSPAGEIETWTGSGQALNWDRRILAWNASIMPIDVAVDNIGRLLIGDGLQPRLLRQEPDFMLVVLAEFAPGSALSAVAVDADGHYLVGDYGLRRVWRVEADAEGVERIFGDGTVRASGDDGPAANATLNQPLGLVYDAVGNLYIADRANHLVRRVRADGQIERVAGIGVAGFAGDRGPAIKAQLYHPSGLAFDAVGNLYIADAGNNRVRRVSPQGEIATIVGTGVAGFAGDGGAAQLAQLAQPVAVAVDGAVLYIADAGNGRVRQVDGDGTIRTVAGGGLDRIGDGPALQTELLWPVDVQVESGVLIVDRDAHRLYRLGANGLLRVVAGTGERGVGSAGSQAIFAALDQPLGVLADGAGGAYLADGGNGRIVHIGRDGVLRVIREGLGQPADLAQTAAGLVFTDGQRHRVEVLPLARRVAPVAERVELAAGYEVETVAGLPLPGLLEIAYAPETDILYATHRQGIARVDARGARVDWANFAARSYRVLPMEDGLLVGTPAELGRNQPLTRIGVGPVYLPVELGFAGVEELAWSGAVYVHEIAGSIRRLRGRVLEDYARISPGAALMAGAGDGGLYVVHRQSKALMRLQDIDGDGLVWGPNELRTLTFVDGEAVALAFVGKELFVGTEDGRVLRLADGVLVPFAQGLAPALLSLSGGPDGVLYALEGDGSGGRVLRFAASAPEVGVWPQSVDFGALPLGSEISRNIVLRNDGSAAVELTLEPLAGLIVAGSVRLAAGQVREVEVSFRPNGPEPLAAAMIWRDAMGHAVLQLPTKADVQSPELGATAVVDFGVVEVGQRRAATVVLRNEGRALLRIERVGASAGYTADFTVPVSLLPGEVLRLSVAFAAAARREFRGTLTIFSNDPFKPEHAIALHGVGGVPDLAVLPEAIELGAVQLGQVGRTQLELANTGEVPLVINNILTGNLRFIVSPRQLLIAPGEQRALRFDFRPQVHGNVAGRLSFTTSDPAHPRVSIPFAGLGLSSLLAAPVEQVFGDVVLDKFVVENVLLRNFSTRVVQILGTETRNAQFRVISAPRRLAAGGQGTVQIEYRPTALGTARGTLAVRTDLAEAPVLEIALVGHGLLPTELQFGRPLESLRPGEEFVLALSGRRFFALNGLALDLELPGEWVEFLGMDLAGSALAGEILFVADRRAGHLSLAVSQVGANVGLHGDGLVGLLRFRVRRPQAGAIVLRSAVLRTVGGHKDRLVLDATVVLRPAGDFDGNGRLDLADFFALADRLGQAPTANSVAYDLDGDGRIDLADANLLLAWLGPAGKGVAAAAALRVGWSAAYPNPFNAETVLAFSLPAAQQVQLDIYNILGQPVRHLSDGERSAGLHQLVWDGRDDGGRALTSGLYLAVLRWQDGRAVRRLTLLR